MLAQVKQAIYSLNRAPRWVIFVFAATILALLSLTVYRYQRPSVNLTTLVPADTILYLETPDLGFALKALVANEAFDSAVSRPDFSALDGMPVAVAVSGFDASEKALNDGASEANWRPRFVAISETGFFSWQARSFIEAKLGPFIESSLGGDVRLEKSAIEGGDKYVWSANDGRRSFALLLGSRIYFSNDEPLLDRCLEVERNNQPNLSSNSRIAILKANSSKSAMLGFLSADGVASVSNLMGMSTAISSTDDEVARSLIARTIPQVIQGSVKEISWTASVVKNGIEDVIEFSMDADIAEKLLASTASVEGSRGKAEDFISSDAQGVTRYEFSRPDVAWRTTIEIARSTVDPLNARLMDRLAGGLFESFGITDHGVFLLAAKGRIVSGRFDSEGEEVVAVTEVSDFEAIKPALGLVDFSLPAQDLEGAQLWKSADGDFAAASIGSFAIVGDAESVVRCIKAHAAGSTLAKRPIYPPFTESTAPIVTFGTDSETAEQIIDALAARTDANQRITSGFVTETRFGGRGIQRKTTSPFGLFGTLVSQFAPRR